MSTMAKLSDNGATNNIGTKSENNKHSKNNNHTTIMTPSTRIIHPQPPPSTSQSATRKSRILSNTTTTKSYALLLSTTIFFSIATSSSVVTAAKSDCPPAFNGRSPTSACKGYVDCVNGVQTAKYDCGAGTIYDASSGICNWPMMVTCNYVEYGTDDSSATDPTGNDADTNNNSNNNNNNINVKVCPDGFTGMIPTTDCLGHVFCTNGNPGLSSKCPPNTLYNAMSMACQPKENVQCDYLSKPPENHEDLSVANVKDWNIFCPDGFTGRAPTIRCGGYVECTSGKVSSGSGVRYCPSGTKFDVMTRSCSYADGVDCEAVAVPTKMPTMSPKVGATALNSTVKEVEEEEDLIVVPSGCQPGQTGYASLGGCRSYVHCQDGAQTQSFTCAGGTLFDAALGYCNWEDTVKCLTSSPTKSPTPAPQAPSASPSTFPPTVSPSNSPTPLDLDGVIYYPNFALKACVNDGNQPKGITSNYLFSGAKGCCQFFFAPNLEECIKASLPSDSPTLAPTGERLWYPDYVGGGCLNDGGHSEWEWNFFYTYEACCQFEWLHYDSCMDKLPGAPTASPIAPIRFYPDYINNMCLDDGKQSSFESNIFGSFEECCQYEWIDYDTCIQYPPGTHKPNKNIVDGNLYYPDYNDHVCRNDGKQSEFEVNLFATRQDCCNFPWVDYDTCIKADYSESGQDAGNPHEWYPDFREHYCKNDGNPPENVFISADYEECCSRFYSGSMEDCRAKSQGIGVEAEVSDVAELDVEQGWYPDFDARACRDDGNHDGSTTLSETYTLCCSRFMADDRHECFANSSPETLKPTPYPTPFPTSPKNQPTNKPTRKRMKKKPTTAPTREPTNEPTPFPTPPPSPPPTKTTLQNLWYPDISTSRCVKNPEYTPPLVESFESYESCCSYAWIIYVDDCLDDAKENDVFYPDYFNGVCLNDGRQSPYENNVYSKAEDCCRNPNVDYSKCMLTFNKGGAPTRVYYPDYFFNVCRHDGKQSDSETNLFDNVEDCCSIDWMSAGSCIDNSD